MPQWCTVYQVKFKQEKYFLRERALPALQLVHINHSVIQCIMLEMSLCLTCGNKSCSGILQIMITDLCCSFVPNFL